MLYNTIAILGGHKLAVSYYRKIEAAQLGGNLSYKNLFCVTNDPDAFALKDLPATAVVKSDPASWVADLAQNNTLETDAVVPDHTAKHVMLQAFLKIAERDFPNRLAALKSIANGPSTPFQYKSENDALWAMSYATWSCPPDCAEPAICPHTQKHRDWDFFESLESLRPTASDQDKVLYTFGCQPLVAEISWIPAQKIANAFVDFKSRITANSTFSVTVATHSHCHGIMGQFELTEPQRSL